MVGGKVKYDDKIVIGDLYESAVSSYNKISFVVITHKGHVLELERMIASLPERVEVCIVNTEKSEESKFTVGEVRIENNRLLRFGTWEYRQFSFSTARNYSIELATYDWCVWVDSDDVLVREQHNDLLEIVNLPNGVGGVVYCCTGARSQHDKTSPLYHSTEQLRAFRKSTGARFAGLVHEQIRPQIDAAEYGIYESGLIVIHLGYDGEEKKTILAKLRRNLKLLALQILSSEYLRTYYEEMTAKTIILIHEIEGAKT